MKGKSKFGSSQGVEICSSKLKHTGNICVHNYSAKKGAIRAHHKGKKGGKGY